MCLHLNAVSVDQTKKNRVLGALCWIRTLAAALALVVAVHACLVLGICVAGTEHDASAVVLVTVAGHTVLIRGAWSRMHQRATNPGSTHLHSPRYTRSGRKSTSVTCPCSALADRPKCRHHRWSSRWRTPYIPSRSVLGHLQRSTDRVMRNRPVHPSRHCGEQAWHTLLRSA